MVPPKRIGPILALVMVAASLSSGARAQNHNLIVPGQRIGPIALGMSPSDLIRIKGDPDPSKTMIAANQSIYHWSDLSVIIRADNSTVRYICASSPAYATAQGIHVGSSDLSVTALMGKPLSSEVFGSPGSGNPPYVANLFWSGIQITYSVNPTVTSICVFRPGEK